MTTRETLELLAWTLVLGGVGTALLGASVGWW